MRIMVYSLLWVMQDLYHQPYFWEFLKALLLPALRCQCVLNPFRLGLLFLSWAPADMGVRIRGTLGDIDPLNKVPFKRAISRVKVSLVLPEKTLNLKPCPQP